MRKLEAWEKDCVIEVNEFIDSCKRGSFIDYDGFGHPMVNGFVLDKYIYPSSIEDIPVGTTHIVWYNK